MSHFRKDIEALDRAPRTGWEERYGFQGVGKKRGLVWVERIEGLTAIVRFENGEGMRGREQRVRLHDLDFDTANLRRRFPGIASRFR